MKEKTIGQLVKEHPDKSYRDLERYRDADRIEEAQRIPVTESRQKQEELEPIEGEEESLQKELGACITAGMERDRIAMKTMKNTKEVKNEYDYHRYWKDMYEKAQARIKELEKNRSLNTMDEVAYRELEYKNKELEGGLANSLSVNESHQKLNGKLQERLTELEEENKKIHDHLNKRIESARKSGM